MAARSSCTVDLARRVDELELSRSAAVSSAEAERHRIERDLHDGAQQRLVALAMDLGRARERFDTEPESARQLVTRLTRRQRRRSPNFGTWPVASTRPC